MIIEIPNRLDFKNSIRFCEILDQIDDSGKYVFDYKNMDFFEPFGMLLISAKIRQFMDSHKDAQFDITNYQHLSYAANMGFFQSIYQDFGKSPGELPGNSNYIPICRISVSELYDKSFKSSEHIVDIIEKEAQRLAIVLSKDNNNIKKVLTYSIREIMRNVVEHSQSDSIWFAGQYWPTKNRVEITILDEGIGIRKTLSKNTILKIRDDEDAIFLALQPGISSEMVDRSSIDTYANSGYGLYMTSRICKEGGDFVMCSNSRALGVNSRILTFFDTSFKGTVIRMRLNVSKIKSLEALIPIFLKEGEKIAKQNRKMSFISASKITSILIDS